MNAVSLKCRMPIRHFPAFILLCTVILAVASVPVCATGIVYIKPEHYDSHCPGKPCCPLSHYVMHVPQHFASDTTMVFLNGTHYLEAFQPLVIKDVENSTMVGSGGFTIGLEDLPEARSKIECMSNHVSTSSM